MDYYGTNQIAILKRNGAHLYCGNCRIMIPKVREVCPFCGRQFSNYETLLLDLYEEKHKDEGNVFGGVGEQNCAKQEDVLS